MPKRGNGEGTISKLNDGRWQARLRLPDGKRKSFYGKTQREALRKLSDARMSVQKGLPLFDERQTLAHFLETWLQTKQHTVKPKTWQRYAEIVSLHLVPTFGRTPLAQLAPQQVEALYVEKLKAGLSATTVHHLHVVLHTALESALRKGLVAHNVTDRVEAPRSQHHEMQTLSEDEARQFFQAVADERLEALYVLALTTGMRQGELLALQWPDVDLEQGKVLVRFTLQNIRGKLELAEPKTKSSRRTIPLTDRAIAALRAHRARQLAERMTLGPAWDQTSHFVFSTSLGGPLDASHMLGRSFFAVLKRANLPRIRFHDLRHTAATIAIARGAPIKAVSEMLGHADVATTLRIYAHVTPGMQQQTVATLNAVFGS